MTGTSAPALIFTRQYSLQTGGAARTSHVHGFLSREGLSCILEVVHPVLWFTAVPGDRPLVVCTSAREAA